jgi:hypothetical protein
MRFAERSSWILRGRIRANEGPWNIDQIEAAQVSSAMSALSLLFFLVTIPSSVP